MCNKIWWSPHYFLKMVLDKLVWPLITCSRLTLLNFTNKNTVQPGSRVAKSEKCYRILKVSSKILHKKFYTEIVNWVHKVKNYRTTKKGHETFTSSTKFRQHILWIKHFTQLPKYLHDPGLCRSPLFATVQLCQFLDKIKHSG